MKPAPLLLCLAFAASLTCIGHADPAAELRDLDRQLAEGRISKAEHDRRWGEIVSASTRAPTPVVHVPTLKAEKPDRLPNEFSLSGTITAVESTDIGEALYTAKAMIGFFVTPKIQLSVGGSYGDATVDDVDFALIDAFGVADYHFKTSGVFVPYAGAGGGWTHVEHNDRQSEDWFWNAHVGMKQYIGHDTALKYEVGYTRYDANDLSGVCFSFGVCALF